MKQILIEVIEASNAALNKLIKTLNEQANNSELIEIINKVIKNESISQEQYDTLKQEFEEIKDKYSSNLSEDDLNSIRFTIDFVLNRRIGLDEIDEDLELDDIQSEIYKKVINLLNVTLSSENVEDLQEEIEKNNKLIEALSANKRFELFDELLEYFRKDSRIEYGIKLPDQLKIVRELIINNSNLSVAKQEEINNEIANVQSQQVQVQVQPVQEPVEEVQPKKKNIKYNNTEEQIVNALEECGYNDVYEKFDDNQKKYISKHVDLENMKLVLNKLREYGLILRTDKPTKISAFKMVIHYSTVELIEKFVQLCDKYSISKQRFLNNTTKLIYITNSTRAKSIDSIYENVTRNIEYLISKGIDVADGIAVDALVKDSDEIKRNYELFSEVYGCKINEHNLDGLTESGELDWIDRFIEVSPNGLVYAKENITTRKNCIDEGEKLYYEIYLRDTVGLRDSLDEKEPEIISAAGSSGNYRLTKRMHPYFDVLEDMIKPVKLTLPNGQMEKLDSYDIEYVSKIDEKVFELEGIKFLDEHYMKDNKFLYIINGTRISRQKVLRVINTFIKNGKEIGDDEIKYALAYHSILTEETIKNVIDFRTAYKIEEAKEAEKIKKGWGK